MRLAFLCRFLGHNYQKLIAENFIGLQCKRCGHRRQVTLDFIDNFMIRFIDASEQ